MPKTLVNVHGRTATPEFNHRLNQLMQAVFGFSFQRFQGLDVWDEDYEYFGFVDDGELIANVGVYHMMLVMQGRERKVLQIGAVATAESRRLQGLARQLFEEVLQRYPDVPMYLYGGDDVTAFYDKFGFRTAVENQPYICDAAGNVPGGYRSSGRCIPLALTDPKVDQYLQRRAVFSEILDCTNPYAVNWFHLAYNYSDSIYEMSQDRGLAIFQKEGSVLRLLDLVLPQPLAFAELCQELPLRGITRLEFGFTPDFLLETYDVKPYVEADCNFMVKGWSPEDVGGFLPRLTRT